MPGDVIVIDRDGNVFVNGYMLEEPYISEKGLGECDIEFPFTVPENTYFLMGDHRSTSIDSRSTVIGCIPTEQIVGKLFFKVWPLSVMLYPSLSSYWNSRTQSQAIIDYEKILEAIPDEDYSVEFLRADEYNSALAKLEAPLIQHKTLDGYMDILNVSGTGIFGYISIEKIGLELPVYHTTSDTVLSTIHS